MNLEQFETELKIRLTEITEVSQFFSWGKDVPQGEAIARLRLAKIVNDAKTQRKILVYHLAILVSGTYSQVDTRCKGLAFNLTEAFNSWNSISAGGKYVKLESVNILEIESYTQDTPYNRLERVKGGVSAELTCYY